MSDRDHLRDYDVYNNLIEKYENSIVIVSDKPVKIFLQDVNNGVRVIMENGNTEVNFLRGEDE